MLLKCNESTTLEDLSEGILLENIGENARKGEEYLSSLNSGPVSYFFEVLKIRGILSLMLPSLFSPR